MISLQYPGRSDFAAALSKKMDNETSLPTIEEIEQLVYEIQRETVEAGKIVKFTTTVSVDSQPTELEVVRIGNYGAVANGQYLFFDPEAGSLKVPAVQPSGLPALV